MLGRKPDVSLTAAWAQVPVDGRRIEHEYVDSYITNRKMFSKSFKDAGVLGSTSPYRIAAVIT